MPKLIAVSQTFTVNQGNDPTSPIIGYTDLALLLSDYYGKNIRQGNSFKVMGYTANLSCDSQSDDADTGLSVQGVTQYLPTTKHSRAAWNHQFKRWARQKQLSGHLGRLTRNDDMEMAWDGTGETSRTSTLFAQGLGDSDGEEKLVLTGSSTPGARSSLTDLYNSMNPIHADSRDEFSGNIKSPKFLNKFPNVQNFTWTAHASSSFQWSDLEENPVVVDTMEADPESIHYMGASSHQDMVSFPGGTYVPVLCGVMKHIYYVLPPDVDSGDNPPTAEDDWTLTLTFYNKSWTPLVYRAKKAIKKAMNRSTGRRGKSYGRKRRYRRRR